MLFGLCTCPPDSAHALRIYAHALRIMHMLSGFRSRSPDLFHAFSLNYICFRIFRMFFPSLYSYITESMLFFTI